MSLHNTHRKREQMYAQFERLKAHAITLARSGELISGHWMSEESHFARFTKGLIRQSGAVSQRELNLTLTAEQRRASLTLTLCGVFEQDRARVERALERLRALLPALPADPLLPPPPSVITDVDHGAVYGGEDGGSELSPQEALSAFLKQASGLDVVGILMSGEVARGVFNSQGLTRWRQRPSHQLDWSVVHSADRAVKCGWAGASWDLSALERALSDARAQLDALGRPAHTLSPGMYRALLAPSAVHELFDTLNSWGAWSARNLKEGQSPLEQLARGERSFSPMINARESATGLAPAFEEHGEERRAVQLVKRGAWGGPLINPRLALREDLTSTGALESEVAQTFELEGGELPLSDTLKALGTGVYVSDLWYLNFSDKARACVTGTTRFATMWVEGGEVVAPLSVMRFDDCLYDILGERLEALSVERSLSVSTSTYGRRSLSSSLCPAALCSGLRFTL